MEARYLTNERGERVGVIMDLDEFATIVDAYRTISQAASNLERYALALSGSADVEEARRRYAEALEVLADARRRLASAEEELDELEDREAAAALGEDLVRIERRDAELIPWEESKARRRSRG